MADDVEVRFGAAIDGLLGGVNEAKAAIESVTAPVQAVAQAFMELGEVVLVAFAVDKVADFVSEMAELGEQVTRASAILGTSTTKAQELGLVAKVTGGSLEGLAQTVSRFELNLQRAQSGTGTAAEGFKALGINVKAMIALPVDERLKMFADAVSKFADGGNKTADVAAAGGRGLAQLIPFLNEGAKGMEDLAKAGEDTGLILSQKTVKGLDDTYRSIQLAKTAFETLGASIVGSFSKSLTEAIDGLTKFVGGLAILVQTGTLGEAAMIKLGSAFKEVGANILNSAQILADFAQPWLWGRITKDWQDGIANIIRIQKDGDEQIAALVEKSKAQLNSVLNTTAPTDKKQAPALAVPNTDALKAQTEEYQNQIKLADAAFNQTKERLASEVKLHEISVGEETSQLLTALAERRAIEDASATAEMKLYAQGTAGYQKALDEKLVLDQKYAADRQKIIDQSVQQETKEWESTLKPIESAFSSQLRGLLSGTETWGQAMKKIFADLVIQVIEGFEKIAFAKLAVALASAFGDPAAMFASAAKSIQSSVGVVFAGEAANLALSLGPAAPAAAAGIAASVQATALTLSATGFDVGTDRILTDGLAFVHRNEQIIPAQGSGPASGSGGAGGGSVVINNPMIGTQRQLTTMVSQFASIQEILREPHAVARMVADMSPPLFPSLPGITYPVDRKKRWNTVKADAISGKRTRFPNWTYPLFDYTLSFSFLRENLGLAEWQTLEGFVDLVNGPAQLFSYDDPNDDSVTAQNFGIGDGISATGFQLVRTLGGFTAPVFLINGVPSITVAGSPTVPASISPYGLVTFSSPPAAGSILQWTGMYYQPCRFDDDEFDFSNFMSQLWELKAMKFSTEKLP